MTIELGRRAAQAPTVRLLVYMMATDYRLQHYVPAAYLQAWDEGGKPRGRKSVIHVFRIDGRRVRKASAESVCRQKFFYASTRRSEAEAYFSEFEAGWARMAAQLETGAFKNPEALASLLLLQAAYFTLRNPSFENLTELARIDAYKQAIETFLKAVYLGNDVPPTIQEAQKRLLATWSVHVLPWKDEYFITSDNPVTLLAAKRGLIDVVWLPVSPRRAVIALRRSRFSLSAAKITTDDIRRLNSYTVLNCGTELFSHLPWDSETIQYLDKWRALRPRTPRALHPGRIQVSTLPYAYHGLELSFLKLDREAVPEEDTA